MKSISNRRRVLRPSLCKFPTGCTYSENGPCGWSVLGNPGGHHPHFCLRPLFRPSLRRCRLRPNASPIIRDGVFRRLPRALQASQQNRHSQGSACPLITLYPLDLLLGYATQKKVPPIPDPFKQGLAFSRSLPLPEICAPPWIRPGVLSPYRIEFDVPCDSCHAPTRWRRNPKAENYVWCP